MYFETPSSLEVQANLRSDYKHHCTSKFLVAITLQMVQYHGYRLFMVVAPVMVHPVRNSGFLDLLEPYDTVMADRGFKIKSDLTMKTCYLAIPPSAAKGTQMTKDDVSETNRVANVRIFVEKAIA